jgi:hypothetical protein
MGVLLLLDAALAWSAIRHPSRRPADKLVPAGFRTETDR